MEGAISSISPPVGVPLFAQHKIVSAIIVFKTKFVNSLTRNVRLNTN